jgi:hypothetical protein
MLAIPLSHKLALFVFELKIVGQAYPHHLPDHELKKDMTRTLFFFVFNGYFSEDIVKFLRAEAAQISTLVASIAPIEGFLSPCGLKRVICTLLI